MYRICPLKEQSSDCSQHHPSMKNLLVVELKCTREGTDKMTACQSSDIGQTQSNGNFPQDKPNLSPKLLQFTDILTSMDLVWRECKERLWSLGVSQVEFIIFQAKCSEPRSLQESRTRTGIAQHLMAPAKTQIQSPILLLLLKESPCCSQQEFHC